MRPLTHLYNANLILNEIGKTGKLTIMPIDGEYKNGQLKEIYTDKEAQKEALVLPSQAAAAKAAPKPLMLVFPIKGRTFQVPPKVKKALIENKEYFRGGAAGFEMIPDAVFNKTIIRNSDSGIWLRYMHGRMLTLAAGKERDKVYAFLLGAMTHYALETFGSAYILEYAPGWTEGAAERRIAVERYIDTKLSKAVAKDSRKIALPAEFLASCFSDISEVEAMLASPAPAGAILTLVEKPKEEPEEEPGKKKAAGKESAEKGSAKAGTADKKTSDDAAAKDSAEKKEMIAREIADEGEKKRYKEHLAQYRSEHMLLRNMSKVRNTVRGFVQYDPKTETDVDNVLHTSADRFLLISGWADDLDKAIKEWVAAWEGALQGALNDEGPAAVKKNVKKWYDSNWKAVSGAVSWLSSVKELDSKIKGELTDILHIVSELKESVAIKESAGGAEPFEKLFPEYYKLIYKEYETGIPTDKDINAAFDRRYDNATDLFKLLDNDMKDFGKDPYPYGNAKTEFKAFSMGLAASKLCIIGGKNLDDYLHREGLRIKDPDAVSAFRKLKIKIKIKSDGIKDPGSGVCIPAKFDIIPNTGADIRTLIRRKSYAAKPADKPADEESVIVLPRPMPYDNVRSFKLSKTGLEDWVIESIEVTDADTGWMFASKKNFTIPDEKGVTISLSRSAVKFEEEVLDVPHEMMSWVYSLEGADPTGKDPPAFKPWEYKGYAVYNDIIYPKTDAEKKDGKAEGGKK